MTVDKIIVALLSIGGIIFTYWFFLMKKEDKAFTVNKNSVDITVKGGYSPETISIPKGKTTTFHFIRRDSSSCLEEVIIPDFKIRKYLPMDKEVSIPITPQKEGKYEISCGMNMFHGKIIVKDPEQVEG
ncbi:MAG: cupredoxin domain-containing protein [Candidatus Levybacteria bacterium]|nr:cupredoxin domain-containing protein [Candidatus Levybacteria bacterium]